MDTYKYRVIMYYKTGRRQRTVTARNYGMALRQAVISVGKPLMSDETATVRNLENGNKYRC